MPDRLFWHGHTYQDDRLLGQRDLRHMGLCGLHLELYRPDRIRADVSLPEWTDRQYDADRHYRVQRGKDVRHLGYFGMHRRGVLHLHHRDGGVRHRLHREQEPRQDDLQWRDHHLGLGYVGVRSLRYYGHYRVTSLRLRIHGNANA